MLLGMWLIEVIDVVFRGTLDYFGIVPRSATGLFGIMASPWLHDGFSHLIANTVPFLLLGLIVAWRSHGKIWPITLIIAVVGGLFVWLFGAANTVTVGASGLIFGFFGYLVAAGFLTRKILDVVLAIVVIGLYGSFVWAVLPFTVAPGISWLAHLGGAIAGVLAAYRYAPRWQTK